MNSTIWDWVGDIHRLMEEESDFRTKNWPLIKNPEVLMLIILAYLYFVRVYGPKYMKNKEPYSLKKVIAFYNIAQIVACAYLLHGMLNSGWLDEYSITCQPVDTSHNPKAYRMARLVWWTFILKLVEFLETIFFVLRKKQNQISGLHLYHHISTLLIGWLGTRFSPGGMTTLPVMINCFVHIIMYTYYLVALLGGREMQKKLLNWKKAITVIQMQNRCLIILVFNTIDQLLPCFSTALPNPSSAPFPTRIFSLTNKLFNLDCEQFFPAVTIILLQIQFTVIILHLLNALRLDCKVPSFVIYIFTPNILLLYYMFFNFYRATYKKNKVN